MAKKDKVSSRRVGLDIGLSIGRFFLNTEDLHYGYWADGEKATVQNFAQAQENHSKLILDHIPDGSKRILDVGSGSGNLALKLINKGYQVDCVIPSEFLAEQVQTKLGGQSKIHICGFEQMPPAEAYDLILFGESFQYVKLKESLKKITTMLNPEKLLKQFCNKIGISFSERMLSWSAGRRGSDGIWGRHWYGNVEKSTGFQPYLEKQEDLPDKYKDIYVDCMEYYQRLYQNRLI